MALSFPMIYGTAWKAERTANLVYQALQKGFRAIDTACQAKHYNQSGVGEALTRAVSEGWLKRENVFLQTKFTAIAGQDHRLPYDKNAPLEDQVLQSFQKSLSDLQTDYMDCLLLHGPMQTVAETLRVYTVFEDLVDQGLVLNIGISNIYDTELLSTVYDKVRIKPRFIQNRFYADTGFDVSLREYCRQRSIIYQSFWTLTANPHVLNSASVCSLSARHSITTAQVLFAYVRRIGILPLTGTTSEQHMMEDLDVENVRLTDEEFVLVEKSLFGK
jgi:diketogulonate reductase-like aldo/keto reductase